MCRCVNGGSPPLVERVVDDAIDGTLDDGTQIRAAEERCLLRNAPHVEAFDRTATQMERENLLTRLDVGRRDEDQSVEAAGTLERLVDVPGSVRRREHEDPLVVGADRIELLQHLVDERPAGAADVLPAREADRVELVEEEDAGRELPRLHEGVVQVPLGDAEVGIEDLLDPDVREGEAALAGRGPREHGLAAAGRAEEEDARRRRAGRRAHRDRAADTGG